MANFSSDKAAGAASHHAVLAGFLGWTLDAFRFFCSYLSLRYAGTSVWRAQEDIVLTTWATLATRPLGAPAVWLTGRPLRAARAVDGERDLFFRDRTALRIRTELHDVPAVASNVWNRDGRRVGRRRVASDGSGAEAAARRPEWAAAKRVSDRKSSRRTGRKDHLAALGLATGVLVGALPALLALYIRTKVPESKAWKENRLETTGQVLKTVGRDWRLFSYLVVLMTFMMFLSHGTQDLYPDFLKEVHKVSDAIRANIVIVRMSVPLSAR